MNIVTFSKSGNTVSIAATTSSGSTALSITAAGGVVRVFNSGTVPVFVAGGTVAATTDIPIAPGAVEIINFGKISNIAAITATGTATVYFTPGSGT